MFIYLWIYKTLKKHDNKGVYCRMCMLQRSVSIAGLLCRNCVQASHGCFVHDHDVVCMFVFLIYHICLQRGKWIK